MEAAGRGPTLRGLGGGRGPAAWRGFVAAGPAVPGACTLLAALTPAAPWHGTLALNPPEGSPLAFTHLLAAAAGAGLLALAHGLLGGKRRAADGAVAIL